MSKVLWVKFESPIDRNAHIYNDHYYMIISESRIKVYLHKKHIPMLSKLRKNEILNYRDSGDRYLVFDVENKHPDLNSEELFNGFLSRLSTIDFMREWGFDDSKIDKVLARYSQDTSVVFYYANDINYWKDLSNL